MPRATYILELELSYNTWTAVTADWRGDEPLVIERGIEPGQRVARIGRMALALHNPDGRYTPGHASATPGFEIGIGARLKANDGTNTYTLFYGRLAEINPLPNETVRATHESPLHTRIVVEDDMAALVRAQVGAFPMILNATPRDLVNRMVNKALVAPGAFATWRLGHPSAGKLGQTTSLPGDYTGKALDAGQSVFPWAGDTWRADQGARNALEDVCASEGGQFYLAADGAPTFEDRHNRPKHTSIDAALSASLAGLEAIRRESRIANRIEITAYPRDIAAITGTLWTLGHTIKLMPGIPQTVIARYVDPDQLAAFIGAQSVEWPVPGLDYTANTKANGSGDDVTLRVRVQVILGGNAAQIILTSLWPVSNQPIYLTSFRLRGVPLRAYQPVTIAAQDDASFNAHGLQALRVDMPLQDDARAVGDIASAWLANRKDPHPWLAVTVEATASAGLLTHALARDVSDRLALTDAKLALNNAGCFIDGIRHEIRRGGASHRVTWRTSPTDLEAYWIVGADGFANLGQSSRLGY